MTTACCPACGDGALSTFLQVPDVPVHVGVLWPTAEAARSCAKGDLDLALCPTCGLATNTAFDPDRIDYGQKYDNALHASPFFQAFESSLAAHLGDRYDLAGKSVVEIGCGSGHFLGLLCATTGARGIGFDPSHDPAHADPGAAAHVEFVRDEYGQRYGDRPVDLLVCRQTLEHIPDATAFLRDLRKLLGPHDGTVVYFEVPNSTLPFRDLSIWDLIYEHCHYFVAPSLRYAFESTGFEVLDLRETYEGQFLSLEARPTDHVRGRAAAPGDLGGLEQDIAAFRRRFRERRDAWTQRLAGWEAGTRAVVWGGGARAVSFFTMLGVGEQIPYVVDINPRKQGSYLGGGGQEIVAPEFLSDYRPDVVVVLNPLYVDEITADLRDLGSTAEVMTA